MDAKLRMIALAVILSLTLLGAGALLTGGEESDALSGDDLDSTSSVVFHDTGSDTEKWLVKTGSDIILPGNLFEHDGYYLSEWAIGNTASSDTLAVGEEYTVEGDVEIYAVYDTVPNDHDYTHATAYDRNLNEMFTFEWEVFSGINNAPSGWDIFDTGDLYMNYSIEIQSNAEWLEWEVTRGSYYQMDPISSVRFYGEPEPGTYYVTVALEKTRMLTGTLHDSSYIYFELYVPTDGDDIYTISYSTEGASGSIPNESAYYNTAIYLPTGEGLVNGDNTLVAWEITEHDQGTAYYPLGGLYVVTESVTVRAVWEPNPHVIIYNPLGAEGVTGHVGFVEDIRELDSSTTATLEGYEFAGWILESAPDQVYMPGYTFSMPSADVMFVGYWIPEGAETVTVTYNPNEGSLNGMTNVQKVEPGTSIVLPLLGPTRDGYTFNGWVTSTEGSGNHYDPGDVYVVQDDVTLYADWVEDGSGSEGPEDPVIVYHQVLFLPGSESSTSYNPMNVRDGFTVSQPLPNPVRYDGYAFSYWTTDEGRYDFGLPVESDMTLRAVWVKVATLTYDESNPSKVIITAEDSVTTLYIEWGNGDTDEGRGTFEYDYEGTFHGQITIRVKDSTTSQSEWPVTYLEVHAYDETDSGLVSDPPVADITVAEERVDIDGVTYWYLDASGSTLADEWRWYIDGSLIADSETYWYYGTITPGEHTFYLVVEGPGGIDQTEFGFLVEESDPEDPTDPGEPGPDDPNTDPDDPSTDPGDPSTDPDDPVLNPDDPENPDNPSGLIAVITITKTENGYRFSAADSTGDPQYWIWTLDGETEIGTEEVVEYTGQLEDGWHTISLVIFDAEDNWFDAEEDFLVGDSGSDFTLYYVVLVILLALVVLIVLKLRGVI